MLNTLNEGLLPVRAQVLDWLARQQQSMQDLLQKVVNIESGSRNEAGVTAVAHALAERLQAAGVPVQFEPVPGYGVLLHAQVNRKALKPVARPSSSWGTWTRCFQMAPWPSAPTAKRRGATRRRQRYRIGQRMAHEAGRHAVLAQQFGLKREQAQHIIAAGRHLLGAPAAPGPDGRADEVHGLHASGLQACFQSEVEVRRIDTDEGRRLVVQQAPGQRLADARDLAVVAQHLHIAAHGQLVVRRRSISASDRSTCVRPYFASTTKSDRSASSMAISVWARIRPSSVSGPASSRPAVSMMVKRRSTSLASPGRRSRVTPGVSSTSASFFPTRRLKSVDLPTFGRPTMATVKLIRTLAFRPSRPCNQGALPEALMLSSIIWARLDTLFGASASSVICSNHSRARGMSPAL